ncbi:MAG: glutamine-hydrolyzing carbamoyl-phosphate synthase small subunit [Proteobacteria bacterium]|nr:glutamine-hydrolyzing carbamoyl-phosphate synthase small subunit [Pseudomonadota bacterium]
MTDAVLVLADGTVFSGESFGASGEATGEVCFNTSMTGYQEILTDPSYKGELVTMTYTQIGNYGVNKEDYESKEPHLSGFILKEYMDMPSNWRAEGSLGDFLAENNVVGIHGIDTRALVRHIRDNGAQPAIISSSNLDIDSLKTKAKGLPGLAGRDLVKEVTCDEAYTWTEGCWDLDAGYTAGGDSRFHVVAYDFGIKRNILRNLISNGCRVTVVPAATSWKDVLGMSPDGIFLSNGPGDPEPVTYAVENIKNLLGKKPIFGICLGHQLLSIALGGKTYKLKFGHRGGNQPVKDLQSGKVEITSQNHGFAVDIESLKGRAELTHINLNDKTVEGIASKEYSAFSVQYHPEASPGPHDASYLFKRFTDMMSS